MSSDPPDLLDNSIRVLLVGDNFPFDEIKSQLTKPVFSEPLSVPDLQAAIDVVARTPVDILITREPVENADAIQKRFGIPLVAASSIQPRDVPVAIRLEVLRHRAQSRLDEHEASMAAIVNTVADALIATDAAGVVRHLNPAAELLTGWSCGEAEGKPVSRIVSGPAAETIARAIRESTPAVLPADAFLTSRSGVRFPVEGSIATSRAESNRRGAVISMRDASQRRFEEKQLRLEQKMQAIGRLAGGVAHDFNNLLQIILGNCDRALTALPASHPVRFELEQIAQSGLTAASATRQLMNLSRRQSFRRHLVNTNAVISETVRLLRRLVPGNVEVIVDAAPDLWQVSADNPHIEQVLMNLVLNARDASPDGGKIHIGTLNHKDEDGEWVVITVTDHGVGMDASVLDHLFEPFFTTKKSAGGAGLGLAMVHGIVTDLGGFVHVESQPGKGSAVTIYLPRARETFAQASPAQVRAATTPTTESTVLLVEDEPGIRALLRNYLLSRGYNLLEAADPQEALKLADAFEGPIDLLLSDMVMPHMSGPKLATRLIETRPEMRVLFVTGYFADPDSEEDLRSLNAPILQKPFNEQELLYKVKEVLTPAGVWNAQ